MSVTSDSESIITEQNDCVQLIDSNNPNKVPKSTNYFGYMVLAFSALNVIFLGGKRRAFGVFIADLHHGEFNTTSLAELNWIGDSYAALGYISTTFTTAAIIKMNRKYRLSQFIGALMILLACVTSSYVPNPHWLFLTHTVFHGVGSSFILSTVGLIVNDEYFPAKHPHHLLATTLVSGGSVASIVFVELYALIIAQYGWRTSFLILGVVYFIVNCSACFVFSANPSSQASCCKSPSSSKYPALGSPWKQSSWSLLLLWLLDRIITSVVTYGLLLNLTDFRRGYTSSLTSAANLTVLFAAGEASTYVIGALVSSQGKFSHRYMTGRLRYILLASSGLLCVGLMLWEVVAGRTGLEWASGLLAFICGLCLGPSITLLFPAGEELTRLPGRLAYPYSLCGMGIGMAISPLLTAILAQHFRYKWFFVIQAGLIFIKCCALAAICVILTKYRSIPVTECPDIDEVLDFSTSIHDDGRDCNSVTPTYISEIENHNNKDNNDNTDSSNDFLVNSDGKVSNDSSRHDKFNQLAWSLKQHRLSLDTTETINRNVALPNSTPDLITFHNK